MADFDSPAGMTSIIAVAGYSSRHSHPGGPHQQPELSFGLASIVMIGLVLAGDNAVVIGMTARPLLWKQRLAVSDNYRMMIF